jgi:hypothetical protein
MKDYLWERTVITITVIAAVTMAVYGTQFAWQVAHVAYEDHRNLTFNISSLTKRVDGA